MVWDLGTGEPRTLADSHRRAVQSVALAPDGQHALSGASDGEAWWWDVKTGRVRQQLRGHQETVWAVAVSPDGKRALTGGDDGTVRLGKRKPASS